MHGFHTAGYSATWCQLLAAQAGAPMHRARWFCLAVHSSVSNEHIYHLRQIIPPPPSMAEWKAANSISM